MQTLLDLLLRHGLAVVFLSVFAEQVGIPIPAPPMLIAIGVLAGLGNFSILSCLAVATLAALLGDAIWYELGRRRGHAILNLLCRVSLEPDSCVSQTRRRWDRFGSYTLIFAKFVPGLSTVSPPLAGLVRMPFAHFLAFDGIGSALWVSLYLGIGFVFRNQVERAAEFGQRFGSLMVVLAIVALGLYLAWKYFKRRRFIERLRVARISPDELMAMISSGQDVSIIDLRSASEVSEDGARLPSAIWLDPAKLELEAQMIPRDREVILYCS